MMLRKVLAGSSAALALFHVWLFSGQAMAGELSDPGRVLRWLAAFGLVGILILLRSRGHSLVRGRKAVAIWLLAAALHGPSIADRIGTADSPAPPDVVAVLVQLTVALGAVVGLRLLVDARRRRTQRASRPPVDLVFCGTFGALSADAFLRIAPRPPPAS